MISLDTNIFVYAIDEAEGDKHRLAKGIVDACHAGRTPLALQVVGEFYAVVVRRMKRAQWEAAQAARNLATSFPMISAGRQDVLRALAEAASGRFSYWDALLLSTTEAQGCRYLITEDMADGARLGRIEVVHPFDGGQLSQRVERVLETLSQ